MTITLLRRSVQLLVLATLFAIPLLGEYENLLAKTGSPYQVRNKIEKHALFNRLHRLRGEEMAFEPFPIKGDLWWSFTVGDTIIADPLGIVSTAVANSFRLEWVVLSRMGIPVLLALLMGRVFCGWLCPVGFILEMAQRFRKVLNALGLTTLDIQFPRWNKYLVLAICLGFAALGIRLSEWLYGPRVIAAEANSIAVLGLFGVGVPLLLAVFLFEAIVSKRWLCRSVCPGGALYSLLSFGRLFRVDYSKSNCVSCNKCLTVCTMGLEPNKGKIGHECDGCGSCIESCHTAALRYRVVLPRIGWRKAVGVATAALGVLLWLTAPAQAHHVQGVNTNYSEDYPQVPTYDITKEAAGFRVTLTYMDIPVTDRSTGFVMGVYIQVKDRSEQAYRGPLRVVISGEEQESDPADQAGPNREGIYNFRWTYKVKGEYDAQISLPEYDEAVTHFHISMRESGISTPMILISASSVLVILLIQVLAYVKRRTFHSVVSS